jgi:hypothetical protein
MATIVASSVIELWMTIDGLIVLTPLDSRFHFVYHDKDYIWLSHSRDGMFLFQVDVTNPQRLIAETDAYGQLTVIYSEDIDNEVIVLTLSAIRWYLTR